MAKKKSKGKGSVIKKGAMVAAIAAHYFLYEAPNAKRNRGKVKSWMLSARGDVIKAFESHTQEIDKKKYHDTIDMVAKRYRSIQAVNNSELNGLQNELKRHWSRIVKETSPERKAVKKAAKKAVKKTKAKVKKVKTAARKTKSKKKK